MASGILGEGVRCLGPGPLLAWIGPAIEAHHYTVGEEVRRAFLAQQGTQVGCAFTPAAAPSAEAAPAAHRHTLDLAQAAETILRAAGVQQVFSAPPGVGDHPQDFYSHRRDQGTTGRFATLIWITPTVQI
jgi:hypothetical protein